MDFFQRKEVLIPATTWTNLQNSMLSGVSRTQKGKFREIEKNGDYQGLEGERNGEFFV